MGFLTFILNFFHLVPTLKTITPKTCILITGCDSGLGFNLARFCSKHLKLTVVSGCLNIESEGAKILKSKEPNTIPIQLDLLKPETIENTVQLVESLIDQGYKFSALVNNAGVMCFGEFEWQTPDIIESQLNVNLLGTMKLTNKFLPIIRKQKGRIVNVTSHCGLHGLPGLSVYSASKGGLKCWNDALRIELSKYGINVVNFIPGSFVTLSNIAARQNIYANSMRENFNSEQKEFYGSYFDEYNEYLKFISGYKAPCEFDNSELFDKFKIALLNENPKSVYKIEPWRYKFYHFLFKTFPTKIVDWLTEKFVSMPKYRSKIKN